MKKLLVCVVLSFFITSCAAWVPGTKTESNVRKTVELVKSLSKIGVPAACEFIKINKCKYGVVCDELKKCHDVQNKIMSGVELAVVMANKSIDLLVAGDTAGADMYALAALEVLAEVQLLLKELGIKI